MGTSGDLTQPGGLLDTLRNLESAPRSRSRDRHAFTVLPSVEDPQFLIPPAGRMGIEALRVYSPHGLRGRAAKTALTTGLRLGMPLFSNSCIALERQLQPLDQLIARITGETKPYYGVLLGRAARYRKATLQVMSSQGDILGFLKLPLDQPAVERVRSEAAVLLQLEEAPLLRGRIPRVQYTGAWEGSFLLFQTGLPGRPGPKRFAEPHARFLQLLTASVHRGQRSIAQVITDINFQLELVSYTLTRDWRNISEGALAAVERRHGAEFTYCGLIHGDFAPWNTRIDRGSLFVFDWELGSGTWPFLWDEFHFKVQTSILLGIPAAGLLSDRHATSLDTSLFVLYLVWSAIRLIAEGIAPDHPGLKFRRRWITQLTKDRARAALAESAA